MTRDWPHWWTMPVLIFAGITGSGGHSLLGDPELLTVMPPALYFVLLAAVLLSLGVLAGAAVLTVIWALDHLINTWADVNARIDAELAHLRSLPARSEVEA